MPTETNKWGTLYLVLAIVALLLSVPSLAAESIGAVSNALHCTGGFVDTSATCASSGALSVYSVMIVLALTGIAFGIVLIPLTLIVAGFVLYKAVRTMEDGRKRLWTLILAGLTVLVQIYPLYILISSFF